MFSSSGSCSSLGPLLGYGKRTKLIFTIGIGGMRFTRRYSNSHMGIASSKARRSLPVLETCPLYTVCQPDDVSSEINIAVFPGMDKEGTSLEDGKLNGPWSKTCRGVFGSGWLIFSYITRVSFVHTEAVFELTDGVAARSGVGC